MGGAARWFPCCRGWTCPVDGIAGIVLMEADHYHKSIISPHSSSLVVNGGGLLHYIVQKSGRFGGRLQDPLVTDTSQWKEEGQGGLKHMVSWSTQKRCISTPHISGRKSGTHRAELQRIWEMSSCVSFEMGSGTLSVLCQLDGLE